MSLLVEKSLKSFLTPKYVEMYVEMYRYKASRTEQKGNGWCVSESTLLLSRNQKNHFIYPFDPWALDIRPPKTQNSSAPSCDKKPPIFKRLTFKQYGLAGEQLKRPSLRACF